MSYRTLRLLCLVFAIVGICCLSFLSTTGMVSIFVLALCIASWCFSVFCGILLIVYKIRSPERRGFAVSTIALAVSTVGLLIIFSTPLEVQVWRRPIRARGACLAQLSRLHKLLMEHAQANDGRLTFDKEWHNVLTNSDGTLSTDFLCPSETTSEQLCSYSLNENALDKALQDLPSDLVLLFEGTNGDLPNASERELNYGNHRLLGVFSYCNVLLIDGTVETIRNRQENSMRWE